MNDDKRSESQKKQSYTDKEINELAEWMDDLTLKQAFFIKDSYEAMLQMNAIEYGGHLHVH